MASDRTEKATPKRREDARRKGQIARRPELASVAGFLAALLMLRATGDSLTERALHLFKSCMAGAGTSAPLTPVLAQKIFGDAALDLAALSLPVIAAVIAASLAANFAQGGLTLTPEALKPKLDRFNPTANLKRAFGSNGPVELVKGLIKISCLVLVGYAVFARSIKSVPALVGIPSAQTLSALGAILYDIGLRTGGALLAIAAMDYGYGWYKHEKSLRMTKQEVKDEYRQQEGDPLVKSQRRRAARAITQRRIAVEVPRADVIVTNPTHFAVALRYDRQKDAAPTVVAKGADEMARRIREIAKAHGVAIVENPPLARALYRTVETGRVIPPEFFRAIAELLAYVYKRRGEVIAKG